MILRLSILAILVPVFADATWNFSDVTSSAGFNYSHGYADSTFTEQRIIAGGVACGDYNGDDWPDLFVVGGTAGPNRLFRNEGDGTFTDVAPGAGLAVTGMEGCGPSFADWDGDGDLDLFVGAVRFNPPALYRNEGDGTFADITALTGVAPDLSTFSIAFADFDRDGDLDLCLAHWRTPADSTHLYRNEGNGTFIDFDAAAGVSDMGYSFTPNFADWNDDGWPDLLVASDFGTSKVFENAGDGTFLDVTTAVITDENGMGAAVADYDNDGDLDWFVSSIWDTASQPEGNWGSSGNRLYRNDNATSSTPRTKREFASAGGAGEVPSPTSITTAISIYFT
ncbi:MAG: VCBS repeat-containing protein [Gemmatimonadetes bacterium]|nr:VCBS repeat-containing protein [Gemmatimonadota bacterium]